MTLLEELCHWRRALSVHSLTPVLTHSVSRLQWKIQSPSFLLLLSSLPLADIALKEYCGKAGCNAVFGELRMETLPPRTL